MQSEYLVGLWLALGGALVFLFFCITLYIIAWWKIFNKSGEAGWKSLIPVYNRFIQFKLCCSVKMFAVSLAVELASSLLFYINQQAGNTVLALCSSALGIAAFVFEIIFNLKMSKAFGHGTGFGIGLLFLPTIFQMILGFGKSKYIGKSVNEKPKKKSESKDAI